MNGKVAQLADKVVGALSDDLLKPEYRALTDRHPLAGHCSVASEALYFLVGGKRAGWKPGNVVHEGMQHWYLIAPDGEIVDLTAAQFDTPVNYTAGRGRGFQTPKKNTPSKRAQIVLDRIKELA